MDDIRSTGDATDSARNMQQVIRGWKNDAESILDLWIDEEKINFYLYINL